MRPIFKTLGFTRMTEVEDLVRFCQGRNARFLNSNGDSDIQVFHRLGAPVGPEKEDALRSAIPCSVPELLAFYQRANGAKLFANANDPEESFSFVPMEYFEAEKAAVYEWLTLTEPEDPSEWGEDVGEDGSICIYGPPAWWKSAIVFGHFGYSPECLVVAAAGPHTGKVFQLGHEISALDLVFESVGELFSVIVGDPTAFILDRYCGAYFNVVAFGQESA